jgi:hypothetical protein
MNIAMLAVAKRPEVADEMRWRAQAAVEYVDEVFGRQGGRRYATENACLYNSDQAGSAWAVPVFIECENSVLSCSQPPVPLAVEVSAGTYERVASEAFRQGRYEQFLPNYFGSELRSDGSARAWSDLYGFGRAYYVETPDFVAASNHIGVLAFFLEGGPEMDHVAWGLNSVFGWFAGDRSTVAGIRTIPAGSYVDVPRWGAPRIVKYADDVALLGARDVAPAFADVMDELRQVSRNIGAMTTHTPRVFLSGGQDSRISAGAWLSAGAAAEVTTYGTLEAESEIARELMSVFRDGAPDADERVTHVIRVPSPSETVTPMDERIRRSLSAWDGDVATNVISRDVPSGRGARQLSVGGMGGELMHGYFYLGDGMLDAVRRMPTPAMRLKRVFAGRSTPDEWHVAAGEVIEAAISDAESLGHTGPSSLDLFYLYEKYRRWPNSRLSSAAVLPLAAPSLVRAAFDLTPEQRLSKVGQVALAEAAVAGWGTIPYYKASSAEAKTSFARRGLRVWQKDPDALADVIASRRHWPRYVREDRIDQFYALALNGEGVGVHESWFHRCMLSEYFPEHLRELGRRTRAAGERASVEESRHYWRIDTASVGS